MARDTQARPPFLRYFVDLIRFGLIPEFIGRLPVVASVNHLDSGALVRILTEPRNSLVKQYQGLFDMGDVKIHFSQAALYTIANQAIEKQTGARGLRRIMVHCFLGDMHNMTTWSSIRFFWHCSLTYFLYRIFLKINRRYCYSMSCMMHQILRSNIS